MASINVDKLSLKDLNDLEAKLAKAKANVREKTKAETREKIDGILAAAGFTISDLYGIGKRGRGGRSSAAKFANPDNRSETWTGRGRKPNWLVAKLAKGAKMADFEI